MRFQHKISLFIAFAATSLFACTDTRANKDPSPSTATSTESAVAPASFAVVEPKPGDGNITDILRDESAKATKRGLKPVAELRASWCGPCVALEKSMTDARMKDAFAGTYVIRFDVDAWSKTIASSGLDGSAIPVFFMLTPDGKPTGRKIDGGAWGDNIPENMAPPLKAFFHG